MLPNNIFFSIHIKQFWHFQRVTTKWYYIYFLEFMLMNTDILWRYYWAIYIFLGFKQYYTLFSGFILKNSDTFTEILPYNSTHFFHSSFQTIHFQRDTTKHYILFVRVRIKPYRHFQRVTTKQYYIHFSSFISHNTFLVSYYRIIHIFSEFIWHNIETSRVTTKKVL